MKNLNFLPLALVSIALFTSCDNDAEKVNEEEVITTVTTTLVSGASSIVLKSRDLDGDGPNAPVITVSGDLKASTTYTGATTFLNETESPAENKTEEIKNEGDEHQIFYQSPASIGAFTYTDLDIDGRPIGLAFTLRTSAAAATGNLTVTLRHEPSKTASGVASGNIANAGGSTDIEVVFPVKVIL